MGANYIYRSGAAPTVVDTLTEMTREVATAAAQRLQGAGFSSIVEIAPAPAWTLDTNADEYTAVFLLDGKGLDGARQEFPWGGFGALGPGATIAPFPLYQEPLVSPVELKSTGANDVATAFVQHGDTVALGFQAAGLVYV